MKLVIFAEGTATTDTAEKKNSFQELWKWLVKRCNVPEGSFEIQGFSKSELVVMYKNWQGGNARELSMGPDGETRPLIKPQYPNAEALDLRIIRTYGAELNGVERLIIALDREPKHNALTNKCRQAELLLVLLSLGASPHLPATFRDAALQLHDFYYNQTIPKQPRLNPQSKIEILVMERLFEDLLLQDEKGFRDAIGLDQWPQNWPTFTASTANPDRDIFIRACGFAPPGTKHFLGDRRGDRAGACRDKARWAKYILEKLDPTSSVWDHKIYTRLQRLVYGVSCSQNKLSIR